MNNWYMLTVIGRDRPGIVAAVTSALYGGGCNLGEASMLRLGGNFTIMLMVRYPGDARSLEALLEPVCSGWELRSHVDPIEGRLHEHVEPDARISVFGADRAGIVSRVTSALVDAGLDILDLESDVIGDEQNPVYVMHIEGRAKQGIEALQGALTGIAEEGIDVHVTPVDTMMG